MIQFSFNRFGKLAQWSLTNDKKYHLKSFLQTFVILLLVFLFFTVAKVKFNGNDAFYTACAISVIVSFAVTVILGSSFMFYSMEGKHDMQALLMLPASNLEKYLMRYSSWLILLPIQLVAFFAADLLQYIFNALLGNGNTTFVTTEFVNMMSNGWHKVPAELHVSFATSMVFLMAWLHSFYALGATLFRSKKYNWILTTIVLILLGVVLSWLFPEGAERIDRMPSLLEVLIGGAWIVVNFWLSYRFFCHQQVIGKLVNL